MKISELIYDLQRLQKDYGDADVLLDIKVSKRIWKGSRITSIGYSGIIMGGTYIISGNIEKESKE